MKKITTLLLTLPFLFAFIPYNTNPTREDYLIQGYWQMQAATLDTNGADTLLNGFFPSCVRDDKYYFYESKEVRKDDNATVCKPTEEDFSSFETTSQPTILTIASWNLSSTKDTLELNSNQPIKFKVLQLDSQYMKLQSLDSLSPTTIVYKHNFLP